MDNEDINQDSLVEQALQILRRKHYRQPFFSFSFREDGVYVAYHLTSMNAKAGRIDDLVTELKLIGLAGCSEAFASEVLKSPGKYFFIAPPISEDRKREGIMEIEITHGGFAAELSIYPPIAGKPITKEDVLNECENKNIKYGLKESAIEETVALGMFKEVRNILIAEGKKSVNGENAEFKYLIEYSQDLSPTELEDGRVDFRELSIVRFVEKDQLLAEKIPATEGIAGVSVTGEEIPARPGKDFVLPTGKGVERTDEGRYLKAGVSGCPIFSGRQIRVLPIYEIKGDVDFSTGNIYFMGSVLVRGGIKPGFKVKATGNVEVLQGVDDGIIEADGKVLIRRGVFGHQKSLITAGGEVAVKFCENATIKSKENVRILSSCIFSNVSAAKKVIVEGKRGLITGGYVRAGEVIAAKNVGSNLGTQTTLEVGIDPEIREQLQQIEIKIEENNFNLEKIKRVLTSMEIQKVKKNITDEKNENTINKLKRTKYLLQEKLKFLAVEKKSILETVPEEKKCKISIAGIIYPGVKIVIRDIIKTIDDTSKGATYIEKEGAIIAT